MQHTRATAQRDASCNSNILGTPSQSSATHCGGNIHLDGASRPAAGQAHSDTNGGSTFISWLQGRTLRVPGFQLVQHVPALLLAVVVLVLDLLLLLMIPSLSRWTRHAVAAIGVGLAFKCIISNNNWNANYIFGTGKISNHNPVTNHIDARSLTLSVLSAPPAPPAPLLSDMSVSTTLPAKPTVFHGRDEFVDDAVQLLTANTAARIAILGSGGMGKTSVALALLHSTAVVKHYGDGRLFLSCEALVDADAVVVALAKLFDLPASGDLLKAVVRHLSAMPHVVLVLDNLETVWLSGGAPVAAVEELLGRLAQIPSLSLIITCRGTDVPRSVDWTNENRAALEPFSLEAALQTFQDRAGRHLTVAEEHTAKQLLNAVDRMPLAVSLLGQLARRGNSVSELLDRWNREHTLLLRTHKSGRVNNVEISIEISIKMLREAYHSGEALQLLSLCCLLPDGLHPEVFKQLQPKFKHIERARDDLFAFALVNVGADRVLKTLSPIRHLVSTRYPAEPQLHEALCSIYLGIAQQLPVFTDEKYRDLAAAAAPEIDNLASLLLTLVSQPSEQVVDAVICFTDFSYGQLPTITLASSLLPHLESHPEWKARCLQAIGNSQTKLGDYRSAIKSLTTAARLFLELGDWFEAARCQRSAGQPYMLLDEYDNAERLMNEARVVFVELGNEYEEARCRIGLGVLMRLKHDYPTAIEHLSAARHILNSLHRTLDAAVCSQSLGIVYLHQDNLTSAAAELEAACTAFSRIGSSYSVAQCTRSLGDVRRRQGEFTLAERLLTKAETFFKKTEDRFGMAECAFKFGHLRWDQKRSVDAITHFKLAAGLYEGLQMKKSEQVRKLIKMLESFIVARGHD